MRDDEPKIVFGVVAIVVVIVSVLLLVNGAHTSTIMSKVGASVNNSGASTDSAGEPPAPTQAGSDSGGGEATGQGGQVAAAAPGPPVLLIVRTGTLTLEVTSVSSTVSAADDVVAAAGGFVAASTESATSAEGSANVDYRIPSAAWERTLAGLRALATVKAQQIKTDEVTGAVVDLGARIANLRATEAALQAIMAKAVKIQDVLDVQKQLTDTRGQIEQLTAQKTELQDRASYGSLTVSFQLPPRPAPSPTVAPPPVWDPGADAAAATAKLVRIGQTATTAGIWLGIVGVPVLLAGAIALGLALGLAWLAWRLVGRVRRAMGSSAA